MSEPIRKSTLVRALLLIGLFLGVAAGAAPCRAQTIDQFAIPTPVTNPFGIAAAGGNLWFTESNATNIGKITTAGAITELPMGTSSLYIAADPGGGSLWFTANGISNITTAGVVTNYPGVSGQGIAFTPDGGLWLNHGDGVARAEKSNPSPATTVVYKVASATTTYGVTRGSDGNIWFIVLDHYNTDPNKTGRIAKIDLGLLNGCTGTPASCITEYPVPGGESAVGTSLALGPGSDGAVWSKGIGKVNRIATGRHHHAIRRSGHGRQATSRRDRMARSGTRGPSPGRSDESRLPAP